MYRLPSRNVDAVLAVICLVAFPALSDEKGKLPYKSAGAFAYAEKWCKEGNDCPSGQYLDPNNTDCTHFMQRPKTGLGLRWTSDPYDSVRHSRAVDCAR